MGACAISFTSSELPSACSNGRRKLRSSTLLSTPFPAEPDTFHDLQSCGEWCVSDHDRSDAASLAFPSASREMRRRSENRGECHQTTVLSRPQEEERA